MPVVTDIMRQEIETIKQNGKVPPATFWLYEVLIQETDNKLAAMKNDILDSFTQLMKNNLNITQSSMDKKFTEIQNSKSKDAQDMVSQLRNEMKAIIKKNEEDHVKILNTMQQVLSSQTQLNAALRQINIQSDRIDSLTARVAALE